MKRPTFKLSAVVALVVLQCVVCAVPPAGDAGAAIPPSTDTTDKGAALDITTVPPVVVPTTSNPPVVVPTTTTNAPQPPPTTTTPPQPPPTTTNPTQPTTTTDAPVVPTATTPVPTPDASTTPNPVQSSSRGRPMSSSNGLPVVPSGSIPVSSSGTASVPSPSGSNSSGSAGEGDPPSNKTAIVAGSVVGGIVALALVAGIITWLNRRGGCTARTRRRDKPDFSSHDNEYDLKENHNMAAVGGAGLGMAAAGGAMHSSDNLPPPSPFQHARRFVPPTSNPTGYMNLTDEEYGYHQNNTPGYGQPQGVYQDYNDGSTAGTQSHPDNSQDYQQYGYYGQEYQHDPYGAQHQQHHDPYGAQQGYYNHAPGSNVTSPTVTNVAPYGVHSLKPDEIEQKPNAA